MLGLLMSCSTKVLNSIETVSIEVWAKTITNVRYDVVNQEITILTFKKLSFNIVYWQLFGYRTSTSIKELAPWKQLKWRHGLKNNKICNHVIG